MLHKEAMDKALESINAESIRIDQQITLNTMNSPRFDKKEVVHTEPNAPNTDRQISLVVKGDLTSRKQERADPDSDVVKIISRSSPNLTSRVNE